MGHHSTCCVEDCPNKGYNSDCKFYTFPVASWKQEQRKQWIAAINRKDVDGSPWSPRMYDKICSAHFIGGKKSEDSASPSYVPTIFPTSHTLKVITEDRTATKDKYVMSKGAGQLSSNHDSVNTEFEECLVRVKSEPEEIKSEEKQQAPAGQLSSDNKTVKTEFEECLVHVKSESEEVKSEEKHTEQQDVSTNYIKDEIQLESECVPLIKVEPNVDQEPGINVVEHGFSEKPDIFRTSADACTNEADLERAQSSTPSFFDLRFGYTGSHIGEDADSKTRIDPKPIPCSDYEAYDCDICNKTFQIKCDLIKHIKLHQNKYYCKTCRTNVRSEHDCDAKNRVFICNICERDFVSKHHLIQHLQIHSGAKHYQCKVCQKLFAAKNMLILHKRAHMKVKPYSCTICDKQFTQKYYLTLHERIHTGERPYCCHICNQRYALKTILSLHLRIHKKDGFCCEICDKQFSNKHMLEHHELLHRNNGYSCSECEKRFTYKRDFIEHKRSHTGDNKYCKICKKYFGKPYYKLHQRMHTGIGLHSCKICKKGFISKPVLDAHIRIHTGDKPFSCDICQKQFSQSSTFHKHKRRMHIGGNRDNHGRKLVRDVEKPRVAEVAQEEICLQKSDLIITYGSRAGAAKFSCEICSKQFTKQSSLTQHVQLLHSLLIKQEK